MELHQFFLILALILVVARCCSELAVRWGVPAVIGELCAGLILGPSLLGWVAPDEILKLLAEIGVILLLFEVGMDTDIYRLGSAGAKSAMVAVVGFVLPFVLGFAVSHYAFDLPPVVSLFIGGTLTATSIGITVRVLNDLQRKAAPEAQIVIGATVLDDILGVMALAFLYEFAVEGGVSLGSVLRVSAFILLFMFTAPLASKATIWVIDHFDRRTTNPGLLPTMVVSLILLFGYIAHLMGAPVILAGFAAGIAMGRDFQIRLAEQLRLPFKPMLNWMLAASPEFTERLESQMRPLIHVFTPVFFVMVGVSLNLRLIDWNSAFVWQLSIALLVVAITGKWLAGYVISETRLRQTAIGLSMISRGEVGLIFAQLGLSTRILSTELFAALLLVIALTTLLPPFAL